MARLEKKLNKYITMFRRLWYTCYEGNSEVWKNIAPFIEYQDPLVNAANTSFPQYGTVANP